MDKIKRYFRVRIITFLAYLLTIESKARKIMKWWGMKWWILFYIFLNNNLVDNNLVCFRRIPTFFIIIKQKVLRTIHVFAICLRVHGVCSLACHSSFRWIRCHNWVIQNRKKPLPKATPSNARGISFSAPRWTGMMTTSDAGPQTPTIVSRRKTEKRRSP